MSGRRAATEGALRTVGRLRARPADEEVVRLDVPVDEVLLVDRLHARELRGAPRSTKRDGAQPQSPQAHHLARGHADGLDRELASAHVEQVF